MGCQKNIQNLQGEFVMKKIVLLLVAILSISCFGVNAAAPEFTIDYNSASKKVEISGTAGAREYVTVEVFRVEDYLDDDGEFSIDKAKAALKEAEYEMSVLVFASQTQALLDGKFAFDIKMTNLLDDSTGEILSEEALSEIYAFAIKSGKNETVIKEYLYIDPAEQNEAFDELGEMSQAEKTTVTDHLKDNKYSLGAYVDILKVLDQTKAYDRMYAALVEKDFDVSDKSAATAYLQEAIVMEALNQKKVENIEDYEKELKFTSEDSELKVWYEEEFVDTDVKSKLTSRLEGQGFATLEEYEQAAKEALVLEYVAESDGVQYVTDILDEFDEDIWGKEYKFKSKAVRDCMGTDYSTVDALLDDLLSYKDSSGKNSSGSSSGGRTPSLGGLTGTTATPETPVTPVDPVDPVVPDKFSDIDETFWAKEAIDYMTEKEIVSGNGDGTFGPDDDVTRAEFVKILVNAFGFTEKAEGLTFTDVSESDWHYDFISIAFKNGLAQGMSEEYFGAEEKISRQDMSVMLYNAAKAADKSVELGELKEFSDANEIADYAKEAVNTFASAGVINGTGDGLFEPNAFATRAQAVQIVYNLLTK